MMEAIYFSQTLVLTRAMGCHIQGDVILRSNRREALNSYNMDRFLIPNETRDLDVRTVEIISEPVFDVRISLHEVYRC
jgi:hypothetical protein